MAWDRRAVLSFRCKSRCVYTAPEDQTSGHFCGDIGLRLLPFGGRFKVGLSVLGLAGYEAGR